MSNFMQLSIQKKGGIQFRNRANIDLAKEISSSKEGKEALLRRLI
jgi:hypothetical protein